jgi:hypothetical protein
MGGIRGSCCSATRLGRSSSGLQPAIWQRRHLVQENCEGARRDLVGHASIRWAMIRCQPGRDLIWLNAGRTPGALVIGAGTGPRASTARLTWIKARGARLRNKSVRGAFGGLAGSSVCGIVSHWVERQSVPLPVARGAQLPSTQSGAGHHAECDLEGGSGRSPSRIRAARRPCVMPAAEVLERWPRAAWRPWRWRGRRRCH